MKTRIFSQLLLATLALPLGFSCAAQVTNDFTSATRVTGSEGTNGIYAIISIRRADKPGESPLVEVFVACTNLGEFYGGEIPADKEAAPVLEKMFDEKLLYFAPTNLTCGTIELRDDNGSILHPLKPHDFSLDSFPLTFTLSQAKRSNPQPGRLFPDPLVFSPHLLFRFRLFDYFDVKEKGKYTLTVSEKIYKRASSDSDVCERIDLPPVRISINL